MSLLTHWHYLVVIILLLIGLYAVIARDNLVKKIMGLNLFQVAVIMLYVSMGKVEEGTAPILDHGHLPEGFEATEASLEDAYLVLMHSDTHTAPNASLALAGAGGEA